MQRLEVSGAVRPLYGSLGVKGLNISLEGGKLLGVLFPWLRRSEPSLTCHL